MNNIHILVPGSFKPMHAGHINLIKSYSNDCNVSHVHILIGPGIRDNINQKISYDIAKRLLRNIRKVRIIQVVENSPILTCYNIVNSTPNTIFSMACSDKGHDYKRVTKLENDYSINGKYFNQKPKDTYVISYNCDIKPLVYSGRNDGYNNTAISSTILRKDVLNNDFDNFKTNYPGFDINTILSIWLTLKNKNYE